MTRRRDGLIRPGIKRAFRLALGRRTRSDDVDDEIKLHLELRAERLMRDGVAGDVARDEARRRFGIDAERQLHSIAPKKLLPR
ncbi:MAG: permease prefix domain 1-containing protein [Gemmatimonadota bacterium]